MIATVWGINNMTNCISALLVGPDGAVLNYAVNTVPDSKHQIQHAEANLFWNYKGEIPQGFYVFTSLKSCPSCAGIMFQALSDLDGKLIYELHDPDMCRKV
jgi:tRNA(Arg) A34 adenosine deaminase TadA